MQFDYELMFHSTDDLSDEEINDLLKESEEEAKEMTLAELIAFITNHPNTAVTFDTYRGERS